MGIEVGHVFKLGTKYSKAMKCVYLDENGDENPMVMGSYGIGVGRTMAAVIEQNHDDDGIIWPMGIAPYHVIIIPANLTDAVQMTAARTLYDDLRTAGIETLFDDRDERTGVKFKDADLVGIPVRVVAGKKAGSGILEIKLRASRQIDEIAAGEAVTFIKEIIDKHAQ